jgi:serine protease AprX
MQKQDTQVKHFIEDTNKGEDVTLSVVIRFKEQKLPENLITFVHINPNDKIERRMEQLGMAAGRFCRETLKSLSDRDEVGFISHDYNVKALLNVAAPAVGATNLHNSYGLTGEGVTIAVVDTGIYPHPDLTRPADRIIAFRDFINGRNTPYDDNGHGTHVAGCAAGNGNVSGDKYVAPAPDASLVGVKVLNENGSGTLSNVLAGIDYVIATKDRFNTRIMNLSLGTQATTRYINDPLVQAAQDAWNSGIFVTIAAGNSGPDGRIDSPGIDPLSLTIGAINDRNTLQKSDDIRAPYTSSKPTIDGFIKPDIAVPGSNIISLFAPNSTLANELPQNRIGNAYFQLSGTSMATGLASGISAQLLQAYPTLTPDILKLRLIEASVFFTSDYAGYSIVATALQLIRRTT